MRGWSIGLAVSIGVLTGPTTRAEGQEPLSVPVLAINRVGIPDVTLQQAELQATRLFSAIGITLQWTNAKPAEPYYEAAAQVRVFIVADSRIERNGRKLAIADSDSMAAHAFYERIVGVARDNGANVAALLGHVIAHEMGHLLLPNDSHSWLGLMRAEWDRKQFDDMAKELLTFTSEQGLLIRTRVRSLRSAILGRPSSVIVNSPRPPQPHRHNQ